VQRAEGLRQRGRDERATAVEQGRGFFAGPTTIRVRG
jgi:hypothetical protein